MGVHLVYEIEIVATNLHESDRGTKVLPKLGIANIARQSL